MLQTAGSHATPGSLTPQKSRPSSPSYNVASEVNQEVWEALWGQDGMSAQTMISQQLGTSAHPSAASKQPFQMPWALAQLNCSPFQANTWHQAVSKSQLPDLTPPSHSLGPPRSRSLLSSKTSVTQKKAFL